MMLMRQLELWSLTKAYQHKFQVRLNNYFRQSKKVTNIKLSTRELIKSMGGLGQLSTEKQLALLKAKWVVKALTNTNHPWSCYWRYNSYLLQKHLKLNCPPIVANYKWEKMKINLSPKAPVFPFVTAAYKAWHSLGLKIVITDFNNLSAMPLYQNKWVTTNNPSTSSNPSSIYPANDLVERFISLIGHIRIGELFEPVTPAPRTEYNYSSTNTWRYKLSDCATAFNRLAPVGTSFPVTVMQDIFNSVPGWVRKIMCAGPGSLSSTQVAEGWGANYISDTDPNDSPIGDIYYLSKGGKPKTADYWKLYWYGTADDGESLELLGNNETPGQGWEANWKTAIVPNLRKLAVTVIDNSPHILGWADEVISPDIFTIPTTLAPSLERLVGTKFYSKMEKNPPMIDVPELVKASWQSANHKIRRIGIELLPALNHWTVTEVDKEYHRKKGYSGEVKIHWDFRFKHLHNCPFLLPKYPQLIYQIITDTLKSGLWIIRSHVKNANGHCPCCITPRDPNDTDQPTKAPATVRHMFDTCLMVQEVWTEANQLGHTFWADYTDFNYIEDITLLVHCYEPTRLFKLAVIWALWRYWCKLFYESDDLTPDRLSNMTAEVMMMVRNELIFRLIECRPVIQWLAIRQDRAQKDDQNPRIPEKHFLLVTSQSVITNPQEFDLPLEDELVTAWLGNNTLCYIRNKKIVFNHAEWLIYSSAVNCDAEPAQLDSQEDSDSEELGPPPLCLYGS